MKVVFMGTPEFAVPSLQALIPDHEVLAVFCQPDRPKGRGNKLAPCPVKEVALAHGLPVHQPQRIRAANWAQLLEELAPDVAVVAAFGQILSQRLLDAPRLGCVNVHASLLPRWRGASPIHYAIKEGDAEAGVSIMKMELALDAGPVYAMEAFPLDPRIGRIELEQRLADLGAQLLRRTLPQLAALEPRPQDPADVTFAPIIAKHFGHVDPTQESANAIARSIRAFEGWPGVHCGFRGQKLKLVQAHVVSPAPDAAAGTLVLTGKSDLVLVCAQGSALSLDKLQLPGKNEMPAAAFINGYRPQTGETLTQLAE